VKILAVGQQIRLMLTACSRNTCNGFFSG